jgi:hypothetical protein
MGSSKLGNEFDHFYAINRGNYNLGDREVECLPLQNRQGRTWYTFDRGFTKGLSSAAIRRPGVASILSQDCKEEEIVCDTPAEEEEEEGEEMVCENPPALKWLLPCEVATRRTLEPNPPPLAPINNFIFLQSIKSSQKISKSTYLILAQNHTPQCDSTQMAP